MTLIHGSKSLIPYAYNISTRALKCLTVHYAAHVLDVFEFETSIRIKTFCCCFLNSACRPYRGEHSCFFDNCAVGRTCAVNDCVCANLMMKSEHSCESSWAICRYRKSQKCDFMFSGRVRAQARRSRLTSRRAEVFCYWMQSTYPRNTLKA